MAAASEYRALDGLDVYLPTCQCFALMLMVSLAAVRCAGPSGGASCSVRALPAGSWRAAPLSDVPAELDPSSQFADRASATWFADADRRFVICVDDYSRYGSPRECGSIFQVFHKVNDSWVAGEVMEVICVSALADTSS